MATSAINLRKHLIINLPSVKILKHLIFNYSAAVVNLSLKAFNKGDGGLYYHCNLIDGLIVTYIIILSGVDTMKDS